MEIVVDYDTDDAPPLVRYECSDAPGSWRYVANRECISRIPANVPYARVIEAIFYCAVEMSPYERGEELKHPQSEFEYSRDYKGAVTFAENIPIEKFGHRDFYIGIFGNGRGVCWWSTQIRTSTNSDGSYNIWLTHSLEAHLTDGHLIRIEMKSIDDARDLGRDLLWRMHAPDGPLIRWPIWKRPVHISLAFGFSVLNSGQLPAALRRAMA